MAASQIPSPGGHHLEPTFGSVVAPAPHRRAGRSRVGIVLVSLGVIAVAVACVGIQWGANLSYDEAVVAFDETVEQTRASQTQLEAGLAELTTTTDAASRIAAADDGALTDAESSAALTGALDEASATAAEASALIDKNLPLAGEKPVWAWELFGATAVLNADRTAVASQHAAIDSSRTELADASETVDDAGTAAVRSAADAAQAYEAAHVSARNVDILSLRDAAARLAVSDELDTTVADDYAELESAAAAMLVSEQAELAEKQGPFRDARVQAEAFARGLAPGVLLDFDWSAHVNGFGDGDSMGGLATWWHGDPGYATIELSDSVAAYWPGDRSRALIAHEVGHAISVKCRDMYDDSTQESIEAWATAWAISMGYTDAANGTSAYGAPPQSLIDAAAGCR